MIQGLNKELRYQKYVKIVSGVELEIRNIKSDCPVHGKWPFRRIGETNCFVCCHSDHEGKKADGSLILIDGKPSNK